uniref:Uncharacterized protein n=1 Tax=Amphimedon queenslandica TaxID=400682 RepID=A0A1X7SF81_AMPQE
MVAIAVGAMALVGAGSAVTWWVTRRFESLIDNKVNHMDRLQSIENRVNNVEANMATKEDLAKMAEKLTAQTKSDMAEMEARLSAQSKNDMATLKTELLEAFKSMNGNGHR